MIEQKREERNSKLVKKKRNRTYKNIFRGQFKWAADISTWLRRGNLKRETVSLLIANRKVFITRATELICLAFHYSKRYSLFDIYYSLVELTPLWSLMIYTWDQMTPNLLSTPIAFEVPNLISFILPKLIGTIPYYTIMTSTFIFLQLPLRPGEVEVFICDCKGCGKMLL